MPFEPATFLILLGRLLVGGVFVYAGLRNIANMASLTQIMTARGVPLPRLVLVAGIAVQLVAGALVIAGLWTAFAAATLILFLLVATPMFHNFWNYQGLDRSNRLNGFTAKHRPCRRLPADDRAGTLAGCTVHAGSATPPKRSANSRGFANGGSPAASSQASLGAASR